MAAPEDPATASVPPLEIQGKADSTRDTDLRGAL